MAALVDFKAPSSTKRHLEQESESDEYESAEDVESENDAEETPEEKRLRLAQIYLEELQRKGTKFIRVTFHCLVRLLIKYGNCLLF